MGSISKVCPHPVSAKSTKPNVVFFLVDDFGWGSLSSMGSKFHETPNIDKLAERGITFSNGYAACTVCSPSRAAILTGRYPGRTNLTDWIAGHRHPYAKLKVPDWQMYMDHERTLSALSTCPRGSVPVPEVPNFYAQCVLVRGLTRQ